MERKTNRKCGISQASGIGDHQCNRKCNRKEVFDFSTEIINSVKEKYGIELEREK
jgi:hypothetical protein